jgi:maleylacetoacetate isomerase
MATLPTAKTQIPKLVLYSYWRSSSAYRVRIALAAKELAHEYVAVNLLTGEQTSDAHKAKSPMGYVPCLVVGDRPLVESVAIIELLDEIFPEPKLYPRDPFERAHVRALVEIVNAGTQPLQNRHVLLHFSPDADAQKTWAKHFIVRGLAALESHITTYERTTKTRGTFAFGDELGAADAFLVPQLYNARRFDIDLAPYPRVVRAEQAALATDAVRAAIPENQPDAPPATK